MILIDTNILVFAHNAESPHHVKAKQLIQDVLNFEFEACLAHQNLLEFFSVITNPRSIEKPLTSKVAFSLVENYISASAIKKIYPSPHTLQKTMATVRELALNKAEIFDCYLVETMLENDIFTIYTDNISHLKRYKGIKTINPL